MSQNISQLVLFSYFSISFI